jgi:hypothetical protein
MSEPKKIRCVITVYEDGSVNMESARQIRCISSAGNFKYHDPCSGSVCLRCGVEVEKP